jgi:hypothetical protein
MKIRVHRRPGLQGMTIRSGGFVALSAAFVLGTFADQAMAQQAVMREQDIGNLRLGQRVLVDDGSCPAGQIKELRGMKMTPKGIERARACVGRLGPARK